MNTHDPIDAHMNQRTIDYIEATAKGGAGMVILWNAYLDYPLGARMADGLRIVATQTIHTGLYKTGGAAHKYDCKLSVQMMHAGPWCPAALAGRPSILFSVMREEGIWILER